MKRWSLLWIIFLAACSDEYPVGPSIPPGGEAGEQEVSVKIAFPGSEEGKTKSPSTYAITVAEENTVSTLDIFAFASGGNNVDPSQDIYLYRVTVPASKILPASSDNTKTVETFLRRLPQKQRFVFVANLPSALSLTLTEGVTTQQAIVDQLKFDGSPWHSAQASGAYTPIPMWGQIKDSLLINSSASFSLGTVYLVRSMAKIEVSVASGLTSTFKIKEIYVCNSSDSGYIAPLKSQWSDRVITKTNPASKRMTAPVSYLFPQGGNILERTIYVPESDSLIINGSDSVKPAYLVIQARYSNNNEDDYYRIDFAKEGKYYPLLRNHGYKINIIGAKGGYKSLEEAQKAPMSDFNFSLTLDDSDNADINEVVYIENQYMLGINVSQVLFDWNNSWIGGKGATDYPLSVYTTYADGWTAALSNAPSWVELTGATSGVKNKSGKVTIKVKEDNRTGAERSATLIIRAGMLTKEVTIRQSGGANSRMICFGSANTATTGIPLAFAAAARRGIGNDPFANLSGGIADIEAKVIWQETGDGQATFTAALKTPSSIPGECHIEVTAKAGVKKSGNAIVAIVRKGSGLPFVGSDDVDEVLWSWHIWSMSDDEYMDKDYHNPNVPLFMTRVLGKYDSNQGMFYQWGRKDPFPKELTDVMPMDVANRPVEIADNDNFLKAIKHPTAFYHTKGAHPNWTGSSAPVSNLWGETKTYYDPCPAGWRVPDKPDKTYWTAETAGDFLNGRLSEETGLWQSGSNGLWTSAVGNIFTPSGSGIPGEGTSNSSAGYSVRCIKDIQLIKTSL
jgi:hypothetical protein